MNRDLVEKVTQTLRDVNHNTDDPVFQDYARAAIATTLREMIGISSVEWERTIRAFAAEHGIALDPIGEGKEGEKDGK